MKNQIKELTSTLLEAILEDGKRGVHNTAMDLDLDGLEREYDKIVYAVQGLINLKENEEGFDFKELGERLSKTNPIALTTKDCIKGVIGFYESVLNDAEGESYFEIKFNYTDEEIEELVELINKGITTAIMHGILDSKKAEKH